jgi:hypothetical protein
VAGTNHLPDEPPLIQRPGKNLLGIITSQTYANCIQQLLGEAFKWTDRTPEDFLHEKCS